MATMMTLAQDKLFVPASAGAHECAYCLCSILAGERWVREKIYEPLTDDAKRYLRYHADLFAEENLSCWEKHQMQQTEVSSES